MTIFVPSVVLADNDTQTRRALRKASEAFYKQSGLDKRVRYLEKKYIPRPVREVGGWVFWGVDVYNKRMITYTWEF